MELRQLRSDGGASYRRLDRTGFSQQMRPHPAQPDRKEIDDTPYPNGAPQVRVQQQPQGAARSEWRTRFAQRFGIDGGEIGSDVRNASLISITASRPIFKSQNTLNNFLL